MIKNFPSFKRELNLTQNTTLESFYETLQTKIKRIDQSEASFVNTALTLSGQLSKIHHNFEIFKNRSDALYKDIIEF